MRKEVKAEILMLWESHKLKIKTTIYQFKPGDYFYDNGSCVMINSGDGRVLRRARHDTYTYIQLTNQLVKALPIESYRLIEVDAGGFIHKKHIIS